MKKIFFVLLLVATAISLRFTLSPTKNTTTGNKSVAAIHNDKKFLAQVAGIRKFLKQNPKYNSSVVFLIDMKMPSGKNRFFVYDLQKDSITDSGLVAHGSGSETGIPGRLKFSNIDNSLCTSLGKYSIGNSYDGKFGKAYKLYGLDKTNSNAFARFIVLHKYDAMPYEEQDNPACLSFGCPMVNVKYYERLQKIIDTSGKPILMEIYY